MLGQFRDWKWTAFALLLVSGLLVAASDPLEYYDNVMFWISIAVLVVAGVNAQIFYRGTYRNMASWDQADVAPDGARRCAQFSLVLWIALVFAGRATTFF